MARSVKASPSDKSKKAKPAKPTAPPELVLRLHEPGMTPMHRAGLGGLAATLRALERRIARRLISPDAIPGGPRTEEADKPWRIEPHQITLKFGTSEGAGDYLKKLFAFGFGIKDKLIDLPGTYREELSRAVRAELQLGLTLTFLQFGPHRKLDPPMQSQFDVTGDGVAMVGLSLRACQSFLHQAFWEKLLDKKSGKLGLKPLEAPSAFNPGAVVRHNAYSTATRIDQTTGDVLCLAFALVGCLSLPVNRGVGVLLIPQVNDLATFAEARPRMTPTGLAHCRVAGPGDAALQAQVRLRGKGLARRHRLPGLWSMRLQPTPWNQKQKSRVGTLVIPPFDRGDDALKKFDIALKHLPRRVRSKVDRQTIGRGKIEQPAWFYTESVVRPLIADNLARGRPWYENFVDLMHGLDENKRQKHELVAYETGNLNAMIREPEMTQNNELKLIDAIHRAISMRMGAIYNDTMGKAATKAKLSPTQAVKNRWEGFRDKTRLSLINAKTQEQTREAITLLLARAGVIRDLKDRQAMEMVHGLLFSDDWRRARDLALFALASYRKPQDAEAVPGEPELDEPALTDTPTDEGDSE